MKGNQGTQMTIGSLHRTDGKGPCHHYAYLGMPCDEYEALRAHAGGHCEICGIAEGDTPRGHLVVDHFHGEQGTGASFIRGMICDKCNGGVMTCIDGYKVWGENRKWEAAARAYEANSWQKPSEEALRQMAARTEKLPKVPRRQRPDRSLLNAISIPARRGVPAMAERLRHYLTAEELEQLAELLATETS